MALFLLAAVIPFLILVLYKAVNLLRYVRRAKFTGLPYVITPVLETEVLGFLATPILRYIYHDHLDHGRGWPRWCRFIIKDWSWEDKRLAHDEYGDVFLCVSPEGLICYSADATMGWDVMNRRNDFTKPPDKYSFSSLFSFKFLELLEPYGPNVATAEGATYRFHVRITAPTFGDMSGANELVWNETLYQTQRLSQAWSQQETPRQLQMDVNSLTLSVISLAGFGKRLDWTDTDVRDKDIPKGYKLGFLKALQDTTHYMVAILVLPGWLLNLTPLRKAHLAHMQLDKYLREMIRVEKWRIEDNADHQSSDARGNLLNAVMRASYSEEKTNIPSIPGAQNRKQAFTEDEIMGNLFIYLLAGYETTANAILYGLITLALHPEIQDKVIVEIDAVYASAASDGRTKLSYTQDFEKLEYTYGFMYETFRLYPGVTLITKMITKPQPILVGSPNNTSAAAPPTTYILPAGTRVYLSAPGIHYHPRYWPSPYTLDPHRWTAPSSVHHATGDDDIAVIRPPATTDQAKRIVAADRTRHMRGTLLTFSDGARACLGRKFAQSEYMAFLAALLKDYRVCLPAGGEGSLDPRMVERDLFNKSAGKVTLAPFAEVGLRLERRKI